MHIIAIIILFSKLKGKNVLFFWRLKMFKKFKLIFCFLILLIFIYFSNQIITIKNNQKYFLTLNKNRKEVLNENVSENIENGHWSDQWLQPINLSVKEEPEFDRFIFTGVINGQLGNQAKYFFSLKK